MTGTAHDSGDFDMVVRNPTSLNSVNKNVLKLNTLLKESHLPILVDVFDWATLPGSFRKEIEASFVVLYP